MSRLLMKELGGGGSEQDGVSEHGAAFRLYKTEQLLALSPVSTKVKGLAGQIQLLLLPVQAKCDLCSETPSCSISTGKGVRTPTSDDS